MSGTKSIQHIQIISNIYKAAQDKVPGSPALNPQSFQIVSLHVVEPHESRSGVQLFAMTANGIRLYFSPSFSYGYSSSTGDPGSRPLQLIHIRLPPTNLIHPDEQSHPMRPLLTNYPAVRSSAQASNRPYILASLESSCYIDGLMIATQQGDTDGTDFILCLAPDLTRIGSLGQPQVQAIQQQQSYSYGSGTASSRPPLIEHATLLAIPGRTWAMAAVPRPRTSSTPPGAPSPAVINELGLQFGEFSQQFMLLTNVGLTFLVKRRALDYLKAVLEEIQTEGNVQPIIEFRDRSVLCKLCKYYPDGPDRSFGRDQTCAMLLSLAAGNMFVATDSSQTGITGMVNPDLASVAKQAFYDFGERPIWTERVTYGKGERLVLTTSLLKTYLVPNRKSGLSYI